MSTFQGFGTDYRGWSDKHPDGSNTATLWVVVLAMPVVPRSRDTVLVRSRVARGTTSLTTTYSILKREPARVTEVLRTYFMWWLAMPLPIYLAFVVAFSAPQAAQCIALTGMLVFAIVVFPVIRRYQRRLGAEITRD